jgi:dolichol-phosphate mannosyltransferase
MSPAFLVLPTLNEAENLRRLVSRLREVVADLEILVVDDASSDGTAELADALAGEDARFAVIHRKGPRGYGQALTEGFRQALERGARAVVSMDSDFSHDPAELPRLLSAVEGGADVAIGSRYTAGGRIADWSLSRRVLSATANAFVRILFRLPARDCTSGFRAYRREVLEGIPWDRLHSPGYSFLVEVLYWAGRAPGRSFHEVPICFVDRRLGRSKMGLREIVFGAANLLKLRWQLARRPLSAARAARARPNG